MVLYYIEMAALYKYADCKSFWIELPKQQFDDTYFYFKTNTYHEQTKFVVVGLANCLTKINMVANSDYLLSNNVWLYLVSTLTMIHKTMGWNQFW